MLRKLLKHEYRATFLPIAIICAVLAVFPIVEGILISFFDTADEKTAIFIIGYMFTMFANVLLISAAITVVYVLVAVRFYSHIYGPQGYLTLMLPVSRSKLHLSKYIVSMTWLTLVSLVGFVGIAWPILFCLNIEGYTLWQALFMAVEDIKSGVISASDMWYVLGNIFWFILMYIISYLSMISSLYCSVSLGQLFRKRRVLASVLIFFGIYSIQYILNMVASFVMMFIDVFRSIEEISASQYYSYDVSTITFVITTAISLVFLIVQYIITDRILKKKINLQ